MYRRARARGRFTSSWLVRAAPLEPRCCYRLVFEQLVVLSNESACQLLPAGSTSVRITSDLEGPHCGLLPVGTRRVLGAGGRGSVLSPFALLCFRQRSGSRINERTQVESDRPVAVHGWAGASAPAVSAVVLAASQVDVFCSDITTRVCQLSAAD